MKCDGCGNLIDDGAMQVEDAAVTLRFCDDCAPFELTIIVPPRWHGTFKGEPGETVKALVTSWGADTVELAIPGRGRMILPR